MSLWDSPAFDLSHSSILRASGNPGRPSPATLLPPIRTTPTTYPVLPQPVESTGVISDGQHPIRRAVAHHLRQFHYLREAAKEDSEADGRS
jgi:hypothetical protein